MEVSGQLNAPTTVFPGKRRRYQFGMSLGGP